MVLELPGGLFGQQDVREGATSTSAVTGTLYWSCTGDNFIASTPDVDDVSYGGGGDVGPSAGTVNFVAPVFLPHGAIVTSCIVHGNAAAEDKDWTLRRTNLGVTLVTMATAAINTADTSITSPTIDNSQFAYMISTDALVGLDSDTLYGVIITYTI